MFRSVRIQNFRQFKDLHLENLGRINLITGQNNTGKTSLLEALFLLLSPTNPEVILTIANLRGIETVLADGPNAWGWIFNSAAEAEVVTLSAVDDRAQSVKLRIKSSRSLRMPSSKPPPGDRAPGTLEYVVTTSGRPLVALVFEYEDSWGQHGLSRIRMETDGPRIEHEAGQIHDLPSFFVPNRSPRSTYDAQAYSRIVQANRDHEVVDSLRIVDRRLARLQILDTGMGANVHADFGDGALLPLNVTGQGFSRVLTIVTAIVESAGGVVLIDEIEDGLHHDVMTDVWKAIIAAAHQHDVQLFVTTHSLEAIEAAVGGSEGYEGSLAFYRLEREKSGEIGVVAGEDHRLRSAVKARAELR
ncbi:MAG: AAA family ATPase [Chloroflexi bacterium]|nr:AAA family ATPase [Chloroflexota bacterium]